MSDTTQTVNPSPEGQPPGDLTNILNVHLYEYQAITGRITYWITLQYVTYSVMAAYLVLLGTSKKQLPLLETTLGLQLLVWAWLYATWEIVNDALYLEKDLRKKVADFMNGNAFWGYEPYLSRQRVRHTNWFEQTIGVPLLMTGGAVAWICFVIKVMKSVAWELSDYFLVAINVLVLVMMACRGVQVWLVQQELAKTGCQNQSANSP